MLTLQPASPKTLITKARVFIHLASANEEQKKSAEVDKLKLIGLDAGADKVAEEAKASATRSLEDANEYIKLRMKVVKGADKFEEVAIKAFENDADRDNKVKSVENLYKRLIKSGSDANQFKGKVKEVFKYATFFD